jgi:hypothetical protein
MKKVSKLVRVDKSSSSPTLLSEALGEEQNI